MPWSKRRDKRTKSRGAKETESHVRVSPTIFNTPSKKFVDIVMENRRLTAPKINMQSILRKKWRTLHAKICVFTWLHIGISVGFFPFLMVFPIWHRTKFLLPLSTSTLVIPTIWTLFTTFLHIYLLIYTRLKAGGASQNYHLEPSYLNTHYLLIAITFLYRVRILQHLTPSQIGLG